MIYTAGFVGYVLLSNELADQKTLIRNTATFVCLLRGYTTHSNFLGLQNAGHQTAVDGERQAVDNHVTCALVATRDLFNNNTQFATGKDPYDNVGVLGSRRSLTLDIDTLLKMDTRHLKDPAGGVPQQLVKSQNGPKTRI